MITENERRFKNEILNQTFPGLDLKVDENGNISDIEFPDGWAPAETYLLLCRLLSFFANQWYTLR